jgi:dihydrolipoamide dehydrogenase
MVFNKAKNEYDLVVVGSGAGGRKGAILAAENGKKVAIVEADLIGGDEVNYSGAPLKAMMNSAEIYWRAFSGKELGVRGDFLKYDFLKILERGFKAQEEGEKRAVLALEKVGVEIIRGHAKFVSGNAIEVDGRKIVAGKFLIATGSELLDSGIRGVEKGGFISARDVLTLKKMPKTVFVVGAGSSGVEIAGLFANLGAKVLLAEMAGRLLPREDEEVGQVYDHIFAKRKLTVLTQSRVSKIEKDSLGTKVSFVRGGAEKTVRADAVFLCTGSAPKIRDLGLDKAGISYSAKGIKVDSQFKTSVKNIFAVGDCIGGESSSERAERQAETAIYAMARRQVEETDNFIQITRGFPEVARVGRSEDDCLKYDKSFKKALVPLPEVAFASVSGFSTGFVKLIGAKSGRLLGGTIVAPGASEAAQILAIALQSDMNVADLACLPGWTGVGEAVKRAAEKF